MDYGTRYQLWRAGRHFVDEAPGAELDAILRVEALLLAELRRRLGGSFTIDELVALYDSGTSWCLDVATRAAPSAPTAWDARVGDAAFERYVHDAIDYAGGRQAQQQP